MRIESFGIHVGRSRCSFSWTMLPSNSNAGLALRTGSDAVLLIALERLEQRRVSGMPGQAGLEDLD